MQFLVIYPCLSFKLTAKIRYLNSFKQFKHYYKVVIYLLKPTESLIKSVHLSYNYSLKKNVK